jgi:hypothetical protein
MKIIIIIIIFKFSAAYSYEIFVSDSSYFEHPPGEWSSIGCGTADDYQQCFDYGDFDCDGNNELIGNYSHSAIGLFIHKMIGNLWQMSIIHPKFEPANHIKGMNGSWPVKGFISGDFDDDGYPEILTMADQLVFPPIHKKEYYPFPGCIYIDWKEGEGFVANPLVWGQWGEKISSNKAAIMMPIEIPCTFRTQPCKNNYSDFLVKTLTEFDSMASARLFVLEQPESTFNSVDYRYETLTDVSLDTNYPNEPFYVKHIFLATKAGDIELVFMTSEQENATGVDCIANIFDYDKDGLFDMVVNVGYYDSTGKVLAADVRVYHRLPSNNISDYRFENVFSQKVQGAIFGLPHLANLDGDETDGEEAVLFMTSMKSQHNPFGVSGVATLTYKNETWELLGTYCNDRDLAQEEYMSAYSNTVVMDVDNDGYDDVIVYLIRKIVPIPFEVNAKGAIQEFSGKEYRA